MRPQCFKGRCFGSSFLWSMIFDLTGCVSLAVVLQGICDNVPLVKAVVPKDQSHSFISQGSPDTLVSFLSLLSA